MNGDRYGRAMTTGELVRHDTRSGITTITLDSQHNRNALSAQLLAELHAANGLSLQS